MLLMVLLPARQAALGEAWEGASSVLEVRH